MTDLVATVPVGIPARSIRSVLATMPSGLRNDPLSLSELGGYLRKHCDTQAEKERNKRHALRDEIYRDGGVEFMKGVIDRVFYDPQVRELRKQWVEHTRFDNPLKRVVNELATVYSEPASRAVDGDENNERYQAVLEDIGMHERMYHMSCLLNLHRAILARFRVREMPDETREPVLDWATPSNVRAVLHPNDPTLVVGWLIRTSFRTARPGLNVPAWTLWTDYERVQLREDMAVIEESYVEHGLGRNPWVAVTLSPPGPGFWPGEEGEDLTAAAVATWVANILLLKETKSATKQQTIAGDGTRMSRGQASDSEIPNEIADGQAVNVTDMSMDLSLFRETADHILEHVAQNYGLSSALIKQQGVQSADARELMRVPLRELRLRQQTPLRRFEHALVRVMAAVLAKDDPERAFTPDGWRMQFGESQTPLSRTEEVDLFVKERAAGLDNTTAIIQRRRRGTHEQAMEEMKHNIEMELARNEMMRALAAIGGTPREAMPAHQLQLAAVPDTQEPDEEREPPASSKSFSHR